MTDTPYLSDKELHDFFRLIQKTKEDTARGIEEQHQQEEEEKRLKRHEAIFGTRMSFDTEDKVLETERLVDAQIKLLKSGKAFENAVDLSDLVKIVTQNNETTEMEKEN